VFGKGLIKGLGITLKRGIGPTVTQFYPEERPNLPPRTRSSLALDSKKCIVCGLCTNACPNKAIIMTTEKNDENKKILTGYQIDLGRCLFCGLCTEVCPTQALHMVTDFEHAVYNREEMLWDMLKREVQHG
jgi:NADH-quinone oxidoreductase subunit I